MSPKCRTFALVCIALLLSNSALAQTAQVTGLITDPNGAVVPGATITSRNVETDIKTETVTNNQGYYTLPSLNPGNYETTVRKSGFRTTTRTAVKIDVSQVARI